MHVAFLLDHSIFDRYERVRLIRSFYLTQVGDHLKDRYEAATEVKLNKRGKLQVANKRFARPTKLDLVYVDDSPDYCSADHLASNARLPGAVSRKWRKATNGRFVHSKRSGSATRSQRKRSSGSAVSSTQSNDRHSADGALPSIDSNEPNTIDVDQKPGNDLHSKRTGASTSSSSNSHGSPHSIAAPDSTSSSLSSPHKEFVYEEGAHLDVEPEPHASATDTNDRDGSNAELPDTDEPLEHGLDHHTMHSVNELDGTTRAPAWLGTQGRVCNRSSLSTDSCSLMCCGRGYNTQRVVVREKCNCKFNWCCWVQCDTCTYVKTIHTCK